MIDVRGAKLSVAEPRHDNLPWLDFSKATSLNTCPMWGHIRYVQKRAPRGDGRQLALEAGSACHDVFAAARFATLFETDHNDFAVERSRRHFGTTRHDEMFRHMGSGEQLASRRFNYALEALSTSGYYDDPRDRRRTLQNIEESCLYYLQNYHWDYWRPYVDEDADFIGVEVPFNILIELDHRKFRFVGRADGLINNAFYDGQLEVHENKTGARINDAWAMSFHMSHQVTGYLEASKLVVPSGKGRDISNAVVLGLQIPLPRNVEAGGFVAERVSRNTEQAERWLKWLIGTYDEMMLYMDRPFDAPQYTHSCNRYFRPCQLIPFCQSTREEQEQMLYEEFEAHEWDPLSNED